MPAYQNIAETFNAIRLGYSSSLEYYFHIEAQP